MPHRLVIFQRFRRSPGPRSRRAAALAEALRDTWLVERVGPVGDKPPNRRYLRRWKPDADLVLLIGAPFAPVLMASRRLSRLGIPYVVDLGDPYLIAPSRTANARVRRLRRPWALRAECRMWQSAAGAVVTSESFAATLAARFPGLPILVRPNGYEAQTAPAALRGARDPRVLRLAHFGSLYGRRVDIRPFLAALVSSGLWDEVRFDQYGYLSAETDLAVDGVAIARDGERPWQEIVSSAGEYDAALVVANRHLLGPPSKVFGYMTLPIPRIVLAADVERDETARYVRELDAWLAVESGDPRLAEQVAAHVARPWTDEQLAPPASESWGAVAATIGDFLERVLDAQR